MLRHESTSRLRKQLSQFRQRFVEFRIGDSRSGIENHRLFNGEQAIRPDVAADVKLAALKIALVQIDRIGVAVCLAGDLAKDQVIAGQVDDYKCGATLALLQIGLWKWQDDDVAGYRFAHAASSSGVFQSRASTASLANKPLNDSLSAFELRKRAKS